MPTISLCMIVKNEEKTLARCLDCVHGIADEIVIADTGSTDGTKEIAQKYTDRIYDYQWSDDFSAARNFSYEKATMDYILWLDADDVLLEIDRDRFMHLKKVLDENIDAVMMRYNIEFDSYGNPAFSYYRERLTKRSCGFRWTEPVHECLEVGGNIINSDICITHKKIGETEKGRNLLIYDKLLSEGKGLSPRGQYYYARELMENGKINEAIERFSLFLLGEKGWTEDNINACCELAQCYKILNQPGLALTSLLNSFKYDVPRAESCCRIGYLFLDEKEYQKAAFWFTLAVTVRAPENGWGFMHSDYSDYIPYMELAVCYDRLGEKEKAEAYNNRAGEIKPDSPEFLFNKKYFASIKKEQT